MTLTVRVGVPWTATGPARLGGVWLHSIAPVTGVKFSHAWPGGCLAAAFAWPGRHALVRRGALAEIYDLGTRVWIGPISEISKDGVITAKGLLHEQSRASAMVAGSNAGQYGPSTNIAAVAASAISADRGFRFLPDPGLPNTSLSTTSETTAQLNTLPALLAEFMIRTGRGWKVDENALLAVAASNAQPPPTLILSPDVPAMEVADDTFTTRVTVRHVSQVAGSPPVATQWAHASAVDKVAQDVFGPAEDQDDVTAQGLLTPANAQVLAGAILTDRAARVAYTEPTRATTLTAFNLGRVPRRPTMIRPAEVVRQFGVLDINGRFNPGTSTTWQIVQTDYDDEDPYGVTLTPAGMAPRTTTALVAAMTKLGLIGTPADFT